MSKNRPFVVSIAGFDPSGGAGVLADIKTFEQHQITGLAIITANTLQTESAFFDIEWINIDFVIRSVKMMFEKYKIDAVKIGIVPNLDYLNRILSTIKTISPTTKIVWDPVLKSTTKFEFMNIEDRLDLNKVLSKIDLITPNYNEIEILFPGFVQHQLRIQDEISSSIFLKGGHNPVDIGTDRLFLKNETIDFLPSQIKCFEKHGSGCVLSAAIASNLALNQSPKEACTNAKTYIEKYLSSTHNLIGYHYVP